MLSGAQITQRRIRERSVTNKLEQMWKEAAEASFQALSQHMHGRTEENHQQPVTVVGILG
jgi:hypothetical protein